MSTVLKSSFIWHDYSLVNCPSPVQNPQSCGVIAGSFYIYSSTANINSQGLENSLRDQIATAMNRGDFNHVHPDIVRITYISLQPESTPNPTNQQPVQVSTQQASGNNKGVYIGASVGAFLVLSALVLYGRRRSKENEDNTFAGSNNSSAP